MTAGGMLIFLVVSKKHRHVKRQMPNAAFLHHIFKIGLRSGQSAPSEPVFSYPAAENASVFFAFLYSRENKNRSTVFRLEFCRKRSFEAEIGEILQRRSKE